MKKKVAKITVNAILILFGLVTIYPFVWMVFSSFKKNSEILALHQQLLPKEFILDNYINMNERFNFMQFFANSLFVTLVITVLVVYTSTLCGFVLSKYKFKGRNLLFGFVLGTMMIPWCVTIIPKYTMIQSFGWLDSYKALIIPAMFSGFGIFNMKQHIDTLPDEILEAARIDGANEFQIYWKIVMPLVKPAWLTLIILLFQNLWNTDGGTFIYSEAKKPLSYALHQIVAGGIARTGTSSAVMLIMMAVPITVFILSQSQIIETMAHSGMK